ncbi:MAG: hypothetical protein ABJN43_05225, partial [Sneathiella sp.]
MIALIRTGKPMFLALVVSLIAGAAISDEIPYFTEAVEKGTLPAMQMRLPEEPLMVPLMEGQVEGQYGGSLHTLITGASDVKLMFVYGYARLVGFTPDLEIS